jgi:HK97 family phage prohead protease
MAILAAPSLSSDPVILKGIGDDLVVAGYASVEMVDKQGDLITRGALKDAFGKFMKADGFRNVQLAHSNIQVGTVIPSYTDTSGRIWKSEVDDTGMFVVIKLRGDIEKAREVASEIRKGNLRSFSIGGQAFERVNKSDQTRGDYREIRRMELHEVTICEKGINPEAQFRILKEDNGDTMTNTMTELQSVLERLSKKLDDKDDDDDKENKDAAMDVDDSKKKKDNEEKDAGDLGPLDPDNDGKPGPFGKPKKRETPRDEEEEEEDESMEEMMYGEDMTNKADDMITTDYLAWLEQTAKGAGFDPLAARDHFSKGYGPGESAFDMRGQGSLEGAGEDDSGKRPQPNFGSAPSGNKNVIKGDYLNASNVSSSEIEAAYEVFKAAAEEQNFKADLNNHFTDRFLKESKAEADAIAKQNFDSRAPLVELQKAVLALNDRIDNVSSSSETIAKSAGRATVTIPETAELANMSWDDVHRLAGKALNGGDI